MPQSGSNDEHVIFHPARWAPGFARVKLQMGVMNRFLLGMVCAGVAVAAVAADLKSPDSVKSGLRQLAGEYRDMSRKVTAERYDRIPHDNQEFHEESESLRAAIANEPADFKTKVESALADALTASAHLADVSATHDPKQVHSALDNLATSLQSLNALFPQSVRAEIPAG